MKVLQKEEMPTECALKGNWNAHKHGSYTKGQLELQ